MRRVVFLVFSHSFPLQGDDGWELCEVFENKGVCVRVFSPRNVTFFISLFERSPGGILPVVCEISTMLSIIGKSKFATVVICELFPDVEIPQNAIESGVGLKISCLLCRYLFSLFEGTISSGWFIYFMHIFPRPGFKSAAA